MAGAAVRLLLRRVLVLGLAYLGGAAGEDHWAVLVAGSRSYFNYRHQADVCHAQKVLRERGFDPDKIITMIYDDVANSSSNPFPGRLYNRPAKSLVDAVDVYAGCHKDYTGKDVTPDKFMAVLLGDAAAANGKVLRSGPQDRVFVNFVDHGGVGIIAFPDMTKMLHAKQLISTLKSMHKNGMYQQLLFYLETCESGSMFAGLLDPKLPMYALTAANAKESSWGTYCGDDAKVAGKDLQTCLGDLFSVNWMGDSDRQVAKETLGEQYLRVKKATNKSHVMQYGQVEVFDPELVGDFQGSGEAPGRGIGARRAAAPSSSVDARDVKLQQLYRDYELSFHAPAAKEQLALELRERRAVQALGRALAEHVTGGRDEAEALLAAPLQAGAPFAWTAPLAACHERAVEAFGSSCGWSENRLVLAKVLYQLCERTAGEPGEVFAAVRAACGTGSTPQEEVNILI